jgi:CHASE3 domain sensor protein
MTITKKISLLYALPAVLSLAVGGVSVASLRLMHGVIGKAGG